MKKIIKLTVMSVIIVATMAQGQMSDEFRKMLQNDEFVKNSINKILCSGHVPPIELDENGKVIPYIFPTAESFAKSRNIPPERMTRLLNELLRENIAILEKVMQSNIGKDEWKARNDYNFAALGVFPLFKTLETFHNKDTIVLLKECLQSPNERIRNEAIKYLKIITGETHDPTPAITIKDTPQPEPNIKIIAEPIYPPPQPEPTPPAVVNETAQPIQDKPLEQPEKISSIKTLFGVAIITLLTILGGVVVWRKK